MPKLFLIHHLYFHLCVSWKGANNSIILLWLVRNWTFLEDTTWSSILSALLCMKPCSKPILLHQQEPKPCHHQTAENTEAQKKGSFRAHEEAPHCTYSAHRAGVTKAARSSCGFWGHPCWEKKVSSQQVWTGCLQPGMQPSPPSDQEGRSLPLPLASHLSPLCPAHMVGTICPELLDSIQGVHCQEGLRENQEAHCLCKSRNL